MSTLTLKRTQSAVTISKKKFEELKRAYEELDTIKAILLYDEEKKSGKLKSFKDVNELIDELDH